MTKAQVGLVNVPNVDATALATTFGIAFVPTSLTTRPENFTKGLLLGAIVCVAIAVVLATLASARAPIKAFWKNRALANTTNQLILQDIKLKMLLSEGFAVLAGILFISALALSLLGPKDRDEYLFTENAGTPGAARVVCGNLLEVTSNGEVALVVSSGTKVPVTDQDVLTKLNPASCPAT